MGLTFLDSAHIFYSTGTVDCRNNTIGAITTNTSNSMYPNNFYGIHKSAMAGTTTISNNTIGSTTTANSIHAASVSNSFAQEVFGIYSEGTGTVSISDNTISKLTNATNNTATGKIIGIQTTSGTNTISNNTVRDLTIANRNMASDANASAIGIVQTSTTAAAQTVTGNTISNLSNTFGTFGGAVTGLYYAGPATASMVSGNFIHSLTVGPNCITGAGLYGMYINGGTTTYSNNIISLGDNTAINIYGIQESNGANNYYFNTVYIGGTPIAGTFSSAGARSGISTARDFRNNLFINTRSNNGATGTHYSAIFNTTSLTIDYNDYIASGSGGVLGFFGAFCNTLDDIKNAYQNANSLNTDPLFANATAGTAASGFIPSATLTGVSGTGITIDYTGTTRIASPTMGAYDVSNVWTGTAGTDWNTAGNWSANLVPTSTSNVAIPQVTNDPIVNEAPATPAICNNLSIASGAVVTIVAGKALTVNGILANSAGNTGLVIKSTADGTGSLLNNTAGVSGTVERYILAANWGERKDGWHNLSSPVASQPISPEFVHGFDPGTEDFYKWDEPTNYWINIKSSGGTAWTPGFETDFFVGRGYLVAYESEVTKNFTGNLNVADVAVSNLAISSGNNKSWHLLGNPFASTLTWDATTDWDKQNIGGVAKIWNEAIQGYSDLTSSPATVIPVTNGFMVMVSSATGSLTLPATKRTHSAQGFYKSTIPHLQLVARNTNVGNAQECNIIFNPDASTGFDLMYDGEFLAGYGPQFYSVAGDEKLSTNSLPGFSEETIIPFSFIKNEGTTFTIEATGLETLEPVATIYLKDNKPGINHNLSENPVYAFTSTDGDAPARFELRFGSVGINETPVTQTIKAWYYGRILNVKTTGTLTTIGIFNTQGQNLQNFQLYGSGLKTLQINLPAGVYFARIVNNGIMQTLKMIVQ